MHRYLKHWCLKLFNPYNIFYRKLPVVLVVIVVVVPGRKLPRTIPINLKYSHVLLMNLSKG